MRGRWVGMLLVAGIAATAIPTAALAASGPQPTPTPPGIVLPLPSPLPTLTVPLPLTVPTSAPFSLAPAPVTIQLPTETRTVPEMQAALLSDVNAERASAGLGPLATQSWAQSVAMAHAEDMANARDIWHNYTGYLDIARQAISAYVDGENVGMALTLDRVDAALMASPPHRANILYPLFNSIGIGVAQDSAGYVYVTEDFVDIRPVAATVKAASAAPTPAPAAPAPSPSSLPVPVRPPQPVATPAVNLAAAAEAASPAAGAAPPVGTTAAASATTSSSSTHPTSRSAAVALSTLLLLAGGATTTLRRRRNAAR
jgi:uncharacterized protein YkwD